jgi:periplasmic copper chaperone A
MKKTTFAALTAAAALAVPAAASAHVTLQPGEAAAGSFSKLDVRVPNERDNKGTIKVDVRFPDGFYFLSYQRVPGWRARVYKEKLDRPVDLGGFSVDEQFTRIAPGQFQDFPLSARIPDGAPGSQLVFRAFQTYQRGERVAWTGAPDADQPAPRVTLLPPEED